VTERQTLQKKGGGFSMKKFYQPVRLAARIGFFLVACMLVAMVFAQVFHAGSAVLVDPGNWSAHRNLGHMLALPIMAMGVLSIIGWMPIRFLLTSLGLFGLYFAQYIFLYLMPRIGWPALSALHPVNALVILLSALYAGRASWRLVNEQWQPPGAGARRAALILAATVVGLGTGAASLGSATWPGEAGSQGVAVHSLADATEANIPESFESAKNPFSPADPAAVAAGREIAQQRWIACHAADFKGQQIGATRSADLTKASVKRTERFLMWAITSGSQKGMPGWGALPEEQRWQLVTFIRTLKP
jgi:mono/diheme cytochrome c family protein